MVAVAMMMVVCDHAAIHVSSGKRSTSECDCGKGRDKFDLVHGMVPFFVRASPFSRLHKDRTIRRNFLTKDFGTDNRSNESAARDHEIRLAKAIADALRVLQRGSVAPRRTMRSDYNVNLK